MDRNDFFTKVNVPTFDSNYASSFEQFVETINNNFTRIASLPFLKGDNGSSIIIHKERLYDENNRFTEFGILLVKAIYKELANRTFTNFNGLKSELHSVYTDSEPISSVYSCEQLSPEKISSIPVYYDQYTGEKHLCVPYIFQDSRKNVLQGHYLTSYVDQTKYVIGDSYKKEEGVFVWRFESSDFIPSLYYDENNSLYCWSINGEKSGITAQGVKGEDGNSSKSWLCKGDVSDGYYTGYVKITKVFTNTYDSTEINVEDSGIMEGDLAVVAFESEGKNDVLFGPVVVTTGESTVYLVKMSGNDLLSIENANDFHTLMKSTGKSQAGQNDVLGLYTFGRTQELQNQTDQDSERIPHMFWVDEDETTAHISPVGLNDGNPNRTPDSDLTNTNIKLGYDSLETNNSSISKHKFNKEFDITNSNYVIIPSTNIKVNDFKNVSMIQKGSLHNNKTAKNINMSIDLPSLGIKTSSGEIISIDKIHRLIGNDTKPLDISLELTELNCNWRNDDNTSWGGRSYYDVDLFASSATFNDNNSQAVYVGTTETPIKAKIESKDYFANLQISVIRYDVAFDNENRPLNVRGFYELTDNGLKSDLVCDSGMLLDGIKNIGTKIVMQPDNTNVDCSITVCSIKTYTDVVVYLKPYSNKTDNDLFYLLNPDNFETSYYACLRLRFKEEYGTGKLVLSHLNDNGNLPCDLNNLSGIDDVDKITGTANVVNTITIGTNEENYYIFTCVPNNLNNLTLNSYMITDEYDMTYDGIGKILIDDTNTITNTITKITQNIKHTNGKVTINYLDRNNSIKQTSLVVSFIQNNSSDIDSFKEELKDQQVIYLFKLPVDYNEDYYGNRTIYGVKDNVESSEENEIISTFYFFGTHLDGKEYIISTTSDKVAHGLNNKYYHILNSDFSKNGISRTQNTQSLAGLGITGDTNVYSTKFNNFKWNIGTYNKSFVPYTSGIGCGKLLPFPEDDTYNIQHTVLDNSPWYLTLTKTVKNTVFENIYTDFVFDKSNNVILSNNYVERKLPNGVDCYYLGDLNLNNEPILTKSITEFEIQDFNENNESNSNTDSPGTQNPSDDSNQTVVPGVNPDNPGVVSPA